LGRRIGLINDDDWARFQKKEEDIAGLSVTLRQHKHDGDSLDKWLRRTEITWERVAAWCPELASYSADVIEQVTLEAKYAGYIGRQAEQVERFQRLETKSIPSTFDYAAVPQLRAEAKEKLALIRPASLGQASRISGITPADLAVVMVYLG
jgi:tRNA uridine 5-carboxymethylaminomethyl modification enzyme